MFGKMIRFMRLSKGLKQSELADKLKIANSTLAHYESEYRSITLETANEIANHCDFEIIFHSKKNNKNYKFKDIERMNYDVRVKDTKNQD